MTGDSDEQAKPDGKYMTDYMARALANAISAIGPELMKTRDSFPHAGEAALSAEAEVTAGPCKGRTFKLVLILDPEGD